MNKFCLRCSLKISALQTTLHGLHEKCFVEWFNLIKTSDFEDLFARHSSAKENKRSKDRFERYNSSFFHGTYKKFSAKLENKSYILKVEEKDYPELPYTEYLCNQIAFELGIEIPRFYLIKLNGRLGAFVTQNILDDYPFATLDHVYKFFKKEQRFDCKTLIEIIFNETKTLHDVHRFIELCLFDQLIGNHDRHGRNLAILTLTGNKKKLSPFYDNPSYLGIEDPILLKADHHPRGAIATKLTTEPVLKDYLSEFKELGFEKQIVRFQKKIQKKTPALTQLIQNSHLSSTIKKAILKLFKKRIDILLNEK